MIRIGLTGGIGSGKSTVAAMLRDAGYPVVDADQVARDNMEPGSSVLQEVAEVFGTDILDDNGVLDRAELARRAFSSEEQTQKLNGITHPAIRRESERRLAQFEKEGARAAVYDMPLLIELGLDESMDVTVVVDADAEERVRRLVRSRGLEEQDARNRIARQIDDATRKARADVVIDNNGPLTELEPQVNELVEYIEKML
ncbi:dephospho-CoA kinase [Corynebacterium qintianiae]|uniref:Dephospho-CoA kinase n=1 Tax=Corynebacterium qintianiae TaxID=2709392 RepID=A0A7T0PGK1_9CORY|nr:dephospho-CoA kinase [Corynebacterium qintianiae]QPK84117.1 dephospho-CoA kinase [Corynebacterium qintianiae]